MSIVVILPMEKQKGSDRDLGPIFSMFPPPFVCVHFVGDFLNNQQEVGGFNLLGFRKFGEGQVRDRVLFI